jgi:erythromycin esterase-like protein
MIDVDPIRRCAVVLRRDGHDYDELLERVDDARLVLIGEASHGTHEFYRQRAEITRRLILEKGFHGVAAEADWPDAYRVNRYLRGASDDQDTVDALEGFKRFPTWMWRNADVLDFLGWCREHNDGVTHDERKVGFWGLDLYSLHTSLHEVVAYLDRVDPAAAARARARYACFAPFASSSQLYGMATAAGEVESCEQAVVAQLLELHRNAPSLRLPDGVRAADELFYAQQNALIAQNAEAYYRTMFRGGGSSWNLRDQHMAQTLDALLAHLDRQVGRAKLVVWAHNSHLGDARATEMARRRELNLGQLVRERHGDDALIVGMSTYEGTVTAATDWDSEAERKQVRPALPDSYPALMHATGLPRFMLFLHDRTPATALLDRPRLERFIGVIYRPDTERASHYFQTRLPGEYDVLIHFDQTRAVEPLERTAGWQPPLEPPETFPSAM